MRCWNVRTFKCCHLQFLLKNNTNYFEMGIKGLWSILTPFCERKPLYELQGKTVAIDLSCWICEAQNITEYTIQPRMYLRNLYFRTCFLLLMEVSPVFVLEGKAPTLKYDTIAARNAVQFKGARPKTTDKIKTGKDRSRFHFTLRQCEEMLRYLGLACIQGNGEAEAMCAYLNADGLVDGCISQDSDCFAYGARVVYRNFSISQQGAHAASGGAVDVYDIGKTIECMDFGQNKIVALALFCGSDYSEGISGVGKESVLKLFNRIGDKDVVDHIKNWRKNDSLYAQFERSVSDKNICSSCGHAGKIQAHNKSGCVDCKTTKGCDFSKFKDKRLEIKNELNVRTKALSDPNFPDQTLIDEFLVRKDNVRGLDLKWRQPNLIKFVKFAAKFLTWDEIYAFEKFLPILTRWLLLNRSSATIISPKRIKKKRKPKGVECFEIIWQDCDGFSTDLIPNEQLENVDMEKLWSTIEPQNLVRDAYPELVAQFEQSKTKATKRNRKGNHPVDKIDEMLQNVSISEPKKKQKKIAKAGITTKGNVKPIDAYFGNVNVTKAAAASSTPKKQFDYNRMGGHNDFDKTNDRCGIIDFNSHKIDTTSDRLVDFDGNKRKADNNLDQLVNIDLDQTIIDGDDDLDLSDIISDIIKRPPPDYLANLKIEQDLCVVDNFDNAHSCVDNFNNAHSCVDNFDSAQNIVTNNENDNNCCSTSFFMMNLDENDLFEKTFNAEKESDTDDSDSSSFDAEYVPLTERIKNRL